MLKILEQISDIELKKKLLNIYEKVKEEFTTKPASVKYHHDKKGDMGRHVMEVAIVAVTTYDANPKWYKCTRDDVITAAFIHDFDKLYRYVPSVHWRQLPKYGSQMFQYDTEKLRLNGTAEVVSFCAHCGLLLSPLIINALTFHHGCWSVDAASGGGSLKSLAVLLHFADMLSVVNDGDDGIFTN